MSSHHPQTDTAIAKGPEAATRREKEKQRKKKQAAAKKAAKKVAAQVDHDETTKGNEEARRAAIAAFEASDKQVDDLPPDVQQRIFEKLLPEGLLIQATGYADNWELQWSGDSSLKWLPGLLRVTKKFKKFAARAIGQRYMFIIFYTIPLSDALELELQTTPGQPQVIEGGKAFPRYLREAATSLRICQLQNGCMLRAHGLTVAAFPKLKKLEMLAGDFGSAMKQLASLVNDQGYITTPRGRFNARNKLLRIQKVYEDNGKDFESQARFWNTVQQVVVPRSWDPVLFRFGFDLVLQSTFASTSDTSKTLGDLCSEVLGIRREAFRGLRQGVELEIPFCDDNQDGERIGRLIMRHGDPNPTLILDEEATREYLM